MRRSRCCRSAVGSSSSARSGSLATAIRQRLTRSTTGRRTRSHRSAWLTISTRRPRKSARPDCPTHSPAALRQDTSLMVMAKLYPGSDIDGFTLHEQMHKGGMAVLWRVTKPGIDVPMLMKVPVLFEGEDPAAIVGFEMEQ